MSAVADGFRRWLAMTVLPEWVAKFQLSFYADPRDAVYKELGVE